MSDGVLRARICDTLRDVAAALAATTPSGEDVESLTDRAIVRAYLAQDDAVPDDGDDAAADLATAIAKGSFPLSPFAGLPRLGWTVAHLGDGEEAEAECAAIDEALAGRLATTRWTERYELVFGLVGIGVYALERIATDGGRRLARRVLDHLEQLAHVRERGIAWHTPPEHLPAWQRPLQPSGTYDLGLAHGSPGVIALLARCVAAGVETTRAEHLLRGAVEHVLAARDGQRLPSWQGGSDALPLAWCYGPLGVSISLWSAASATGDAAWRAAALELARGCAALPLADSRVSDAGLCHGSAGAAHCFNRLWHATGDARFADAARTWLEHTLRARRTEPLAGFPRAFARGADGTVEWRADGTLLTGAAGVALALHAAISDIEPAWDRLLLVDLDVA